MKENKNNKNRDADFKSCPLFLDLNGPSRSSIAVLLVLRKLVTWSFSLCRGKGQPDHFLGVEVVWTKPPISLGKLDWLELAIVHWD